MRSVATTKQRVKILYFKHCFKHFVFNEDGDGGRKKVLKNYIDVYVCIDMVCGDTKYELGSEE
ncbi:TPA: hypothetical protein TVG21_000919 [Streptococcus equi subsp. zooepidemicus]|nr:hypothetical protein [Streptococcus equi subsp. zooepidemicus]HEL1084721.1 hypothetical protein [Streptococcus equi subsp. zooepidemicus]